VIGEESYAEMAGDRKDLELSPEASECVSDTGPIDIRNNESLALWSEKLNSPCLLT
jgi:hypothetical protein